MSESDEVPISERCVIAHGSDRDGQRIIRRRDRGYLCAAHRRKLTALTTEIRELLIDLVQITEPNVAPKDETPKTRHIKAAEAPAPANLEVLALLDARTHPVRVPPNPAIRKHQGDSSTPLEPVLFRIASWLGMLIEERNLTETRHRVLIRANRAIAVAPYTALIRAPRSVMAQLAMLERHHDWITEQPWVDDYLIELSDMQDGLRHALNDRMFRVRGRCPLASPTGPGKCGGTLLEENGSGVTRCADCNASWVTPQEQARLALSLEERGA